MQAFFFSATEKMHELVVHGMRKKKTDRGEEAGWVEGRVIRKQMLRH